MARATWGSTDLGGTIGLLHAGAKLRVAYWPAPEGGAAKGPGTVVLVTGRGEFIECYGETISDLRRLGFAVVAFDLRGQGGSSRQSRTGGHVDAFKDYCADIAAVVRFAGEAGLPRPMTVLAHSMGGLAALRAQPLLAREVDRMVLLAPMLQVVELPMPAGLLRTISWIACMIGFARKPARKPTPAVASGRFPVNRVTSDPERYERIAALAEGNRDLCIGAPTFGWLRAALGAMSRTRRQVGEPLDIPTLFVASAADRVVSTPAIDRFARAASGGGMVLVREARHQLLMERDDLRDLFFAAFKAFVSEAGRNGTRAARPARAGRRLKFEVGAQGDPDLVHEGWKIAGLSVPVADVAMAAVSLDRTAVTEAQAGKAAAPALPADDAEAPLAPPRADPATVAAPAASQAAADTGPSPVPRREAALRPEPRLAAHRTVPEPAARPEPRVEPRLSTAPAEPSVARHEPRLEPRPTAAPVETAAPPLPPAEPAAAPEPAFVTAPPDDEAVADVAAAPAPPAADPAKPQPEAAQPANPARYVDVTPGWLGAEEDDRDVVLSLGRVAFTPHQSGPPAPATPADSTPVPPAPEEASPAAATDELSPRARREERAARREERAARRQEREAAAGANRGAARARIRERLRRDGRPHDEEAVAPSVAPEAVPADGGAGPDWTVVSEDPAGAPDDGPDAKGEASLVPRPSTLPPSRRDPLGTRRPGRR